MGDTSEMNFKKGTKWQNLRKMAKSAKKIP